jgi:hypothetical protein
VPGGTAASTAAAWAAIALAAKAPGEAGEAGGAGARDGNAGGDEAGQDREAQGAAKLMEGADEAGTDTGLLGLDVSQGGGRGGHQGGADPEGGRGHANDQTRIGEP